MINKIKNLLHSESAIGILLILAAFLAILFQNINFLSDFYNSFTHYKFLPFPDYKIEGSVHFWVNDALMVLFFFLIGLELKREMMIGQLKDISQVTLPIAAAIGGVLMPAIIFVAINSGNEFAMKGWAIPTATDIAFAVGVLALLGDKVPSSLKLFILTIAIVDDLCAILIIAIFYSDDLNLLFLGLSFIIAIALFLINKANINKKAPYIVLGVLLWFFVLNSGIHATIAGVIVAFCIPLKGKNSMLKSMEHALHTPVNFIILPLFAFVNAGVSLKGIGADQLFGSVSLGIILGLFLGKQIGIFLFSFIIVKLNLANLPKNSNWTQIYAMGMICGIGFTMSLFINNLAYGGSDEFGYADRLAILLGSLISGVSGYLSARFLGKKLD
ncbi:Na+/H+ antiporter NhaA [Campylobacter corcagiensis]|uniref:Na(+)/H(+) antiporter NhaA n=1 Tax=Campylobacter corcagiensis TaxID=1448857 RepID=A0A7M1LG90_9BACT|nr:Na+/H+ antiporter NhaA [Campylobacter corcagiensis]QKF64198.1 sodium:proton antiporter [Campylobacter corcagiensis]QOQ87607.1 Na+/H+ antiporter NhaA [Campylobacter corcagiensis]